MADPLSIAASVAGLLGTSATVLTILRDLCKNAWSAPRSISRVMTEVEEMKTIVGQVEAFMSGAPAEHSRLTMIPLHDLMATLSGCVLVCNELHLYIAEVADLADPSANMNNAKRTWVRVKWACWKEPEIADFVEQLQRHKHSLNLMLNVVQCHSATEAKASIAELRDMMGQLLDENRTIKVQLRELITRRSQSYPDDVLDTALDIEATSNSQTATPDIAGSSLLAPSSSSITTASTSSARKWSSPKGADSSSISTSSSFSRGSIRSVRSMIPSFEVALKGARAYKRLYRHGGLDQDDTQSQSGVSLESSSSDKGCDWSMLSDMSLGDLSISDLAVIELPIYRSDLYDPELYPEMGTASRRGDSSKRRYKWSSKSRIHNAISGGNVFVVRTLLGIGFDIEERDGEGQTPLLHAIRRENEVIIRALLEKGANLEAQDADGRTPLAVAARRELEAIVTLLLDKGANLDTPDAKGLTALWHALLGNNETIVRLFLDKGANLETTDAKGLTPLWHALLGKNEAIVTLLLDQGADREIKNAEGLSPLWYALLGNNETIVKLLLGKGVNLEVQDADGRTPLAVAVRRELEAIVTLLLDKGANLETPDAKGSTALWHALLGKNEAIVTLLLDQGADREIKNAEGLSPLWYALLGNNETIVKLLLGKGVNLEVQDADGRTPLAVAVRRELEAIVTLLLDKGANLETPDAKGLTALWHALLGNNLPIVRLLLDKGANLETTNAKGLTPLWHALLGNNEAIVKLLLGKGVNLEVQNAEGRTPIEYAFLNNRRALVELLLEKGAKIDSLNDVISTTDSTLRIHDAIEHGNKEMVRVLLTLGADVEQRDTQGLTPLALAVLKNDERCVKLLLEKGASSNNLREIGSTRDLKGKIHDAIGAGNENVVRLLLVMGVDVDECGWNRMTPLLNACHFGKSEIAKMLVAQGADVKACDELGWTVLHLAVWRDNASLLTFLLDNGALDVIDVAENDGDTPLHRAAYLDSRLPLAQILVERGARLNIKNKAGHTPYEYALSKPHDVAKYLWSQLEPNERAQLQPPPSD